MSSKELTLEARKEFALQRVDFGRKGCLEAFEKLKASPKATDPAAWEALACEYPLEFVNRPAPVSAGKHAEALAALRAKYGKGATAIRSGAEITYDSPPRIPTESSILQWVTNGGYPIGYVTQLKGPEGGGKTFLALQAARATLLRGGYVLWVALERFDKSWARKCGVCIHFSVEELKQADAGRHPSQMTREEMLLYNKIHPEGARIEVVTGPFGNELLDTVVGSVRLNAWDLVVFDSIALVKNQESIEKKTVGSFEPGGSAYMINQFVARIEAAFNSVEAKVGRVVSEVHKCKGCSAEFETKTEHKKCPETGKTATFDTVKEIGEAVRTACIVINQLRDQGIMSHVAQAPGEPGGRGLKHLKGLELFIETGVPLTVERPDGTIVAYGKQTLVRCTKSKVGPPLREGLVELWFQTVPDVAKAGRFNPIVDLVGARYKDVKRPGVAEMAGLVHYDQPWYVVGEQKTKGLAAFIAWLQANPQIVAMLQQGCDEWIRSEAA